ncbi:MAG: DNA topoisomerase I [Proteobacteria bacterium]|nr:DNA topoisomerase I [Desulfobacula sp.]MBU3950812.1 DNA topoisomerase I [Pseudomonadota bacterium]MBU4129348.1 DNA topoisomerase I [Pseudomonadota bacterium]
MTDDLKSGQENDPVFVKKQLDEILAREIMSFIDVDSDAAMISFNLATISCITIIVEREREIRQYVDSPPERYQRESFTNELVDIGLEKDDYLGTAISSSLKSGYISESENGDFKAEMPSFMMAGFLDSMFPGMQGMNLIAFVLQMNDEVTSGRKTLGLAKQSFEATLKSRGVSVSRDHAEKRASEMASGTQKTPAQTKEISEKLKKRKKENIDRLSILMKSRKKRSDEYTEKIQVTDVFDKGPSKEEIAAQKAEMEKAEAAVRKDAELARQLAQKDEQIKQAEEAAKKAAEQLKEMEEKELALKAAQEKSDALAAREAQMAEREAQLKAMEERFQQKEDQVRKEQEAGSRKEEDRGEKEAVRSEMDIESQIAAFESELAMPCPLCKNGTIEEKTTEKGKRFFSCSKAECRFVSWDKPYHFECPLCKNSFLIEMQASGDKKGLKCPRAACSYTQNNLLDPKLSMANAAASLQPQKKRKVVRRIKRR